MKFGGDESRRAGRWVDRHAREQQWEYVLRIWRPLLVLELVVFVGAFGMMLAFQTMAVSFAAGVIVTVGVVFPAFLVAQQTGTVPTMAGAEAERLTSDDLKRLRRRGWLTVDHIPFHDGDIDHAVIGSTVAYAVETKWSATPWSVEDERIGRYCAQATHSAKRLGLFLRSQSVGLNVRPQPVLVLHGRTSDELNVPVIINGVTVLRGRSLRAWSDALGLAELGADFTAVQSKLATYLRGRDQRVSENQVADSWFVRRGIYGPTRTAFSALVAFLMGLYLSALLLGVRSLPVTARLIGVAVAALLGLVVGRARRLRLIGWAWAAGCLTVLAIVGLLGAYQWAT